ncbi:hypothetical protein [Microbispora triticiradicis]|uniref:Uncharacterized protein n=2 Tax=Microbispora TaxID=2005 RepID=A0ABY3LTP3_9ACTN|nr:MULTISPECIES: hypothetical protein [Microbispora]TLP59489.1 hypothetical protein FED44_14310 [Microbispora fusca]TYB54255.1 hypothetical protein FXF59_22730 [Microbispora tritici]GLW22860.1 hypothetical protein Mame01_29030 [Microbispora amethystogenes]
MGRAAAVLGGGGTLAAAAVSPSAAVALGVVALAVLLIVAGVVFHSSEAPVRRFERLIKAVRPAAGPFRKSVGGRRVVAGDVRVHPARDRVRQDPVEHAGTSRPKDRVQPR